MHPPFTAQSFMFQLLLRNSWLVFEAMNLISWWILCKNPSPPPFIKTLQWILFFSTPSATFIPHPCAPRKEGETLPQTPQEAPGNLPSLWSAGTPLGKGVSRLGSTSLVLQILWCLHSYFCHYLKKPKTMFFYLPPGKVTHNWVLISKVSQKLPSSPLGSH